MAEYFWSSIKEGIVNVKKAGRKPVKVAALRAIR